MIERCKRVREEQNQEYDDSYYDEPSPNHPLERATRHGSFMERAVGARLSLMGRPLHSGQGARQLPRAPDSIC
jgi:hypothetical protein